VSNMFYQDLRDPKRSPTFYVMFRTEFPSPEAADITLTRQSVYWLSRYS
jgi:hypothetical protein